MIRKLESWNDLRGVTSLMHDVWGDTNDLGDYLGCKDSQCLLSISSHLDVIGYVIFYPIDEHTLEIADIAIREEYRGQGKGKQLLQHMSMQHVSLLPGIYRLLLTVQADDEEAVGFYEHLGFKPINTFDHYYGPHEHGLRMEKRFGVTI